MADDINYLDRNEFNFEPSAEVVKAIKDFDVNKLCFYTRLYDEGKKSIFSIALAEDYGVDESQVVFGLWGRRYSEAGCTFLPDRNAGAKRDAHSAIFLVVLSIDRR